MRHAGTALLLVSALGLLGCGKPAEKADDRPPMAAVPHVNPVMPFGGPPKEDALEVNAEKAEGTKAGPAVVAVKRAWETKYGKQLKTLTVAVRIECPKNGKAFPIRGWSADYDLIESLTGEKLDRSGGRDPLPVDYSLSTDGGQKCRAVQRLISRDPETSDQKVPVGTKELRLQPGEVFYLLYEFERPDRDAKELVLDVAGEDFGHLGRVRFRLPATKVVRE